VAGKPLKHINCWFPSRNIHHCQTLMEEIRARGCFVTIDGWGKGHLITQPRNAGSTVAPEFDGWSACIELDDAHDTGDFRSETLCVAVCRAILMAAVLVAQR
jgi:hypothetical protein